MFSRNFWEGFDSRRWDLEGGAVIEDKEDDSFRRKLCEGEITCDEPVIRGQGFEIILGAYASSLLSSSKLILINISNCGIIMIQILDILLSRYELSLPKIALLSLFLSLYRTSDNRLGRR